jgi:serine/threonine protein kinase/Tol biopolymer transport system component
MTAERWQKVREVLHEALQLPPEQRPAFVDRTCSADHDLRQEVELLLAANEQAPSSFLQSPLAARVTLAQGTRVDEYEIEALVGSGGMGEVYRARDLRLGKEVAIKVLPASLSADGDRLRRFEHEARTAAALDHPNILAVYRLGTYQGAPYLVSELLQGETLRERLQGGALPVRKAMDCGVQVARGLAAAHHKGIIHRDLKPENLFLIEDGRVKILDFGLAKLRRTVSPDPSPQRPSSGEVGPQGGGEGLIAHDVPKASIDPEQIARPGAIMGTVGYMSPEQTRGRPVDPRTDIFAFGAILYEMLTGDRAFQGSSAAETMSAVLSQDPPSLSQIAPSIPPALDRLVRRCLEKKPEHRFQTAMDLGFALEALTDTPGARQPAATLRPQRLGRRAARWVAAATVLLVAGIALYRWRAARAPARPEWLQLTDFADSATSPALSPDGRMLTFLRSEDTFFGSGQIYVKLLPNGEPVELTHDDQIKMGPVFSPDGSRITYGTVEHWDTWIVPVLGGEPRRMLRNASGLTWIDSGDLLFSEIKGAGVHMAIVRATESRANERDVYVPPRERGMAHRSYLSPDGKWVLVVEMDNAIWLPCRLVPLDGRGAGKLVGPTGARCTSAAWSPDGRAMYFSSEAGGRFHIWRQPFPKGTLQQLTSGPTDEEGIAMAPDGRPLVTSIGIELSTLWIHDRQGERQVSSEGYASDPLLSADGRTLYYVLSPSGGSAHSTNGELRAADVATARSERVLPGFSVSSYDVSRDSKSVVFTALGVDRKEHIWLAALDRRFPPRQISSGTQESSPVFSPTGDVFFRASEGAFNFVYRMNQDGSGRQKVSSEPILDVDSVSPDGQWLVVFPVLHAGGTPFGELAYPLRGGSPVAVCSGFCGVAWAPDGKSIYLRFERGGSMGGLTGGETVVVPLRPGRVFPPLPVAGLKSASEAASLPGAKIVEEYISPGPDPSVYAFARRTVHRNLYRIPLP